MSHRKPCRSDTTITATAPARVRFPRPRCFCGHVAAAIYPEPDPWSEPMPLTTNWVYECHYTPKQEGMVMPDHCYGCDEELARALRARDVYDREGREHGPGKGSAPNVGTLANYYNPNNIHNVNYHLPSPNMQLGGWTTSASRKSSYGHDHHRASPLSLRRGSSRQSWADTARMAKAKWDAEASHHNPVTRGDQVNIWTEEPESYLTDDTPDLYTTPDNFPSTSTSTSATWEHATSGRMNTPTRSSTYGDVNPSFFATAVSQPNDTVFYHDSSSNPGTISDRVPTGANTDGQALPEFVRRYRPVSRVKVCGFHMHAMEWRKIQSIGTDEAIALAERAQCPKFNLSITRWLDKGFNHLEMEPFNTVNCYCGNALVVTKDYSRNRYELTCRNRYDQSTLGPRHGGPQQLQQQQPSNSVSPRVLDSCSMVIPVNKVKYRPLWEPVHREIRSDDWLSRFFKPPATLGDPGNDQRSGPEALVSAMKKEDNGSFSHYSRARIIRLKALTFKDPISETIHLASPPPSLMTAQDFDSSDWFPLKRLEENETTQALKILQGGHDVDLSDEVFARQMKVAGVCELPTALTQIAVKEGCKDADDYLQATEERMRLDIKQYMERQEQLDILLDAAKKRHANTVGRIRTMESNAQLLPELKCRVCYERQIKFAILPCHHMVLCTECAQIVESCIVCRGPKLGTLRVNLG
ncbi:hypothetical protein F5H01DRAFT_383233 [Linnemannia elongata]|nr:hypothetical protein F5H01DRAFT_383233 [Linnemannia elongata]